MVRNGTTYDADFFWQLVIIIIIIIIIQFE